MAAYLPIAYNGSMVWHVDSTPTGEPTGDITTFETFDDARTALNELMQSNPGWAGQVLEVGD